MARYTSGSWSSTKIDSNAMALARRALTTGPNGRLHVAYGSGGTQNEFRYASYDGSSWNIVSTTQISADPRTYATGVDSTGDLHVLMNSRTSPYEYHSYDGSSWTTESVTSARLFGTPTRGYDLAVDSRDRPHVGFWVDGPGPETAHHAVRSGGNWSATKIDKGGGPDNSLVLDGSKRYLTYRATLELRLATHSSGSWSTRKLLDPPNVPTLDYFELVGVGFYSSAALDGSQRLHVVFHNRGDGSIEYLRFTP